MVWQEAIHSYGDKCFCLATNWSNEEGIKLALQESIYHSGGTKEGANHVSMQNSHFTNVSFSFAYFF